MKLNDAINKIRNLRNKLSNLDMRKSNILEVQKIEFALTDMIREYDNEQHPGSCPPITRESLK